MAFLCFSRNVLLKYAYSKQFAYQVDKHQAGLALSVNVYVCARYSTPESNSLHRIANIIINE